MSGTDDDDLDRPPPTPTLDAERAAIVRTLTTVAALSWGAWMLFLLRQIERMFQVTDQVFAGQWDQRIEVISFAAQAPNSLILAPAAAAAATATWLAGTAQPLELAITLRLTRWAANLMVGILAVSIVSVIINDTNSPTRVGDVAIRMSGVLLTLGMSVLCLAAGRRSPGG